MLEVIGLTKRYRSGIFRQRYVEAVSGVSFSLSRGESLGIVGESGCGKTTVGKLVSRLLVPTAGKVLFKGADIFHLGSAKLQEFRSSVQIIFQEYDTAFDPRWKMSRSLAEPLKLHRLTRSGRPPGATPERLREMMAIVGLQPECLSRYPHELSGGQLQRLALARVLLLRPELIVADEPTSSLDVSVQAQILSLLKELQCRLRLTCLFITHDLDVARQMSDRVLVMYRGRVVEEGRVGSIFEAARHPYTQYLLSSLLVPDPDLVNTRPGRAVDAAPVEERDGRREDGGCVYHSRCLYRGQICAEQAPAPVSLEPEHRVACHLARARLTAYAGSRAALG